MFNCLHDLLFLSSSLSCQDCFLMVDISPHVGKNSLLVHKDNESSLFDMKNYCLGVCFNFISFDYVGMFDFISCLQQTHYVLNVLTDLKHIG